MHDDSKDVQPVYVSDVASGTLESGKANPTYSTDPVNQNLSYGPDGVRGIFSSGYVFGAAFLASLGGFSFGYDQGVISIINVMAQFHHVFPRAETDFGKGFSAFPQHHVLFPD